MPDPLRFIKDKFHRRFWSGIPEDYKPYECWEWQRYCCARTGYGRLTGPHGTKIGAHRASWLILRGKIPDGLFVLHHCDNRKCVNPSHLFLGTHQDNMRDMWAKGRGTKPPRRPPGQSEEERRSANKIRMGTQKTRCTRGHLLPPYEPGRRRLCYEPACKESRRFNASGTGLFPVSKAGP